MRLNLCTTLTILLCTSAAARAFAAASLTPLGFLPGSSSFWSQAIGVSGDGSVVVGRSPSGQGQFAEAFRWTAAGGMQGLGDLPGGYFSSVAWDVSADGSVVVGYGGSDSGGEAFRWTSEGGMVGLGILPGAFSSSAEAVSGDGSVVVGYGYSSNSGSPGYRRAWRWTSEGGMIGMGLLPGGVFESEARGVSGDGSVIIGWSSSASGVDSEAFRWTSEGMVGLGDLPGGNFESVANGVSADGSVIVGVGSSVSGYEAFRWTSDGGMVGLGKLPGAFSSSAECVNGDGSVVIGSTSWYPSSGPGSFYWTADGGMRALWDVLLSHGVDPAADGWTDVDVALGVSADGSTIVGFGTRNGNLEAFVAVIPTIVPEPAAGALALLGVSSILLLRRRSLWR